MVPALVAARKTVANPIVRLGAIYLPNGMSMDSWTPAQAGSEFEFSPTLMPLLPRRDRVLVVSGLRNSAADPGPGEIATGPHSRGPAAWLSGVHSKKMDGTDVRAGITIDQIAARELGIHTQLASLELSLESTEMLGSCDIGYSCAYQSTVSWRSPTVPLPMENDPRAVFERMFGGDTTDPQERLARTRKERSILDSVSTQVRGLQRQLGPNDGAKLGEYLDAVRDVERRIQKAEEQSDREFPVVEQPIGTPATFEEYCKLMFDLQVLAYQVDLTRVITFMMGREVSNRTFPEIGVSEPHHPLSHHQNKPEKKAPKARVDTYHIRMFAYLLERLHATQDGDGSLLDHVMILYGSGISDGDIHNHINLPVLVAAGEPEGSAGGDTSSVRTCL